MATEDNILAMINASRPPVVQTLNGRAVAYDVEQRVLELAFDVAAPYANNADAVQGGIVATMLDAAMGIGIAAGLGSMQNVPTLDLAVSFLRPTPLGPLLCRGQVIRAGRRVAFCESELLSADGKITARGRATSLLPTNDS
ncbi:MAG: PaaI family thioesterase [Pseudomonadota bacterium]